MQFGIATPGPRDDGAVLPGARRRRHRALEAQRVRGADHRRQHRHRPGRDRAAQPRPPGRRRDRRRRRRAVRPARRPDRGVRRHLLVLQLRRRHPDIPGLAQTGDDSSQISYSAGFATGLLLQDTDSTPVAFLGCCDLDFEREAFLAFQAGLQAVDEAFEAVYIPTGDFNDVAGATEAYNQAVAGGVGAVYPFLGGSHEAIVGLANEDGLITMSAGASDACEREDLDYDIAVQFDAGDYLDAALDAILDGDADRGRAHRVHGRRVRDVGAKFCDATRSRKPRWTRSATRSPPASSTSCSARSRARRTVAPPLITRASHDEWLPAPSRPRHAAASRRASVRGITKRYGDVVACDDIDLDLRQGEIHGVLGENGAGKSTLMKILIGLVEPDAGSIEVHGAPRAITDPRRRRRSASAWCTSTSASSTSCGCGRTSCSAKRGRLDRDAARGRVGEIGDRYGLGLDPDAVVGELTAGLRQRVEIVKCLRRDPTIVIFDEPTSVLTPQESEQLFAVLRRRRCATRARPSRWSATSSTRSCTPPTSCHDPAPRPRRRLDARPRTPTPASLAQAMVGRAGVAAVRGDGARPDRQTSRAPPSRRRATARWHAVGRGRRPLRIRDAVVTRPRRSRALDRPDARRVRRRDRRRRRRRGQRAGRPGRRARAASSRSTAVRWRWTARSVPTGRAGAMGAAGIGVIPEDRHASGCVLDLSVAENLWLGRARRRAGARRLDRAERARDRRAS